MGDSSFSDMVPSLDMPNLSSSSRNWVSRSDPLYLPLIAASRSSTLHQESMIPSSPSQVTNTSSSSSSNPQRAPISDDEKIELMRLQGSVGDDQDLPNGWEGLEDIENESPRENFNDSDPNSNRFGRSVYF